MHCWLSAMTLQLLAHMLTIDDMTMINEPLRISTLHVRNKWDVYVDRGGTVWRKHMDVIQ